jgi:hypothetical protein
MAAAKHEGMRNAGHFPYFRAMSRRGDVSYIVLSYIVGSLRIRR